MRKILVLRGGALGDFIVTLPALAWLRNQWPASRIELAGNAVAAELGRREGLLDAVHSQHEARWSSLYSARALPADFAAWLADFDLVLNYWPDPDGELAQRFPLHEGQRYLSAAALPQRAPAAAHYAQPLVELGRTHTAPDNFYRFKNWTARLASSRSKIALHPGSGSPRKNWPVENWIELTHWLRTECRREVLIVLGEAERANGTAEKFADLGDIADSLPLAELAAKLAGCHLFVGHDSGISHLAAACGLPCVLLFGPTDPAMWAPPSSAVQVLRADGALTSLSTTEVQHAVRRALVARS
jgi:heptosyltransferase-3